MWNYEGICGNYKPPSIHQKCPGTMLVLGAGRPLWEDLASIDYHEFDDTMAVNFTYAFYPGYVSHFATLEESMWDFASGLRDRVHDNNDDHHVHRHINTAGFIDGGILWNFGESVRHGTSGLFAVYVAVCLGFSKIVLAGMPLDGNGRFFDKPNTDSGRMAYGDRMIAREWENAIADGSWAHKVRSCSGLTAGLLGKPTEEWLNESSSGDCS